MKHFIPHDSIDCGPACLKMISHHYGREYTLQYLRTITYLNRLGVSIFNLGKAAEKIGFKTMIGELSYNYLIGKSTLPCILYWDKSHFVVLSKIQKTKNKTRLTIYDPGVGKVVLDEEKFKKYWLNENPKGFALFLDPTPEFYNNQLQGNSDEKSKRSAFSFLIHYFTRYRGNYVQVVVAMGVAVLISLVFPFLTQSIVDYGVKWKDIDFIILILIFQLFLFLTNVIAEIIRSQLLAHISARINVSILADFLRKMMKLPMRFFESKMPGDLVQRINDHKIIEEFISSTLLVTVFSVINLGVFSFVLFYYSHIIFFVFMICSGLSVAWTSIFLRWRRSLNYQRFRELANTNDKLYEMVNNIPEIKINRFEKHKQWEWQEIQARLFKLDISSLTLDQYQRIGAEFIDQVRTILVMFLAAQSVIEDRLTLGIMLAISYVIGQLNVPIKELIRFINMFQSTTIGLERMNEVYVEPEEEKTSFEETIVDPNSFQGIEFKNVAFGYLGPHHDQVIKNLSLKIPKGKITAIVGSSGSGKTTLLKLLLKFYEPDGGTILLNGKNLQSYSSEWWRNRCGTVMQEGHIFSDTIRKNIEMSAEVDNNERLVEAIETANISDFVLELPLHVETKIGDSGLGLSTGQKQRILIARAVYKDPEFLFFDEATSSLDATNEREIMENLNQIFQGKTVIVIAHRLSTVRNADQIVLIDNGELKEKGTHEELVEKKGYYFNLIKNQLELGN